MIQILKGDGMPHTVMLDEKVVGYIHQMGSQFRYVPKGKKLSEGGELMSSVEKVIDSLHQGRFSMSTKKHILMLKCIKSTFVGRYFHWRAESPCLSKWVEVTDVVFNDSGVLEVHYVSLDMSDDKQYMHEFQEFVKSTSTSTMRMAGP